MGLLDYVLLPGATHADAGGTAASAGASPSPRTAAAAADAAAAASAEERARRQRPGPPQTAAVPSSSPSPPPPPRVRLAGAALVRGRIRRVWRRRYLELRDDGLVRYAEVLAAASPAWPAPERIRATGTDPRSGSGGGPPRLHKYTLRATGARILDGTTLRDLHVGLPRGTFGFLLRGHRCGEGDDTEDDDRDVYCAVDALEEAQMWVVALQWAAATAAAARRPPADGTSAGPRLRGGTGPPTGDDWTPVANPRGGAREPDSRRRTAAPPAAPPPAPGRIVVAKVVQHRLVRVGWVRFEVAFEIHCLLVHDADRRADLWTVLRTVDDLARLVADLRRDGDAAGRLDAAALGPVLRALPRLRDRPVPADLQRSLSVADALLRSLVMDATLVNARPVRAFLGLSLVAKRPLSEAAPAAAPSVGTAFHLFSTLRFYEPLSVQDRTSEAVTVATDQYVRQWFAAHATRRAPSVATVGAARLLRQPLAAAAGLGVGAMAFRALAGVWQRLAVAAAVPIPVVSMRLDVLILSWVSAAYIGHAVPVKWLLQNMEAGHRETKSSKPKGAVETITDKDSQGSKQLTVESASVLDGGKLLDDDDVDEFTSTGSVPSDTDDDYCARTSQETDGGRLSSPLPRFPENGGMSCWSPADDAMFNVRGESYLTDRIKLPSGPSPLTCRGVDVFLTDSPQRHIARHPAVLGGRLDEEDTFLVNFLLPFGNFVAYFSVPPLSSFPKKLRSVWTKFLKGDQEYRDARLKLLPVVVEGPWIVKTAVGPGNAPALLGKVIPLQYYFREPCARKKAAYEVDVIITASSIAKGILSVVKGSASSVSIAFAFIIEAAEQEELPETVLCSFQIHSISLDTCPILPRLEDSEDDGCAHFIHHD